MTTSPTSPTPGAVRLLDQVRAAIRTRHYSIRTEQAYHDWIRRFILFHNKRHPRQMGAAEIEKFLSHLAVERNVAASTQNQALNAILFLYREVLAIDLPWMDEIVRAKKPQRLPVVFTRDEVSRLLAQLDGTLWLIVSLIYGGGLRLMECLRLRESMGSDSIDPHCALTLNQEPPMARLPRFVLPGQPQHVIQRGNNRQEDLPRQLQFTAFSRLIIPFGFICANLRNLRIIVFVGFRFAQPNLLGHA